MAISRQSALGCPIYSGDEVWLDQKECTGDYGTYLMEESQSQVRGICSVLPKKLLGVANKGQALSGVE